MLSKKGFLKTLEYGDRYCAEHDTLKRKVKPSIVYDVGGFDTTGEVWVCDDCLDIDISARRIKA